MRKLDQEFSKLKIKELNPNVNSNSRNNQIQFNDSSDDFLPMVYEIEEVECRMTDIEERDKNDTSS